VTSPLLISIGKELSDYLYLHSDQIPAEVDKDSLWIICNGHMINDIENYFFTPYESQFEWRVKFNNSFDRDKEYIYLITYKAYFQGETGIMDAKLLS